MATPPCGYSLRHPRTPWEGPAPRWHLLGGHTHAHESCTLSVRDGSVTSKATLRQSPRMQDETTRNTAQAEGASYGQATIREIGLGGVADSGAGGAGSNASRRQRRRKELSWVDVGQMGGWHPELLL